MNIKLMFLYFGLSLTSAFADGYRLILEDVEAQLARLALIDAANSTLKLSYFSFKEDITGYSLCSQLIKAMKEKKVTSVQIIVDGTQHALSKEFIAYLALSNIQIREFHKPSVLTPVNWWWKRMHDKLFIVDGDIPGKAKLLTGSRNMEDAYMFDRKRADFRFLDTEILIDGDEARSAFLYHDALWNSGEVTPVRYVPKLEADVVKIYDHQMLRFQHKIEKFKLEYSEIYQSALKLTDVDKIEFFHDPIGKKGLEVGSELHILELLRNAKKSILIENPYFLPTAELKKEIKDAINRGVKVYALTNSPSLSDSKLFGARYLAERNLFVDMGIELWEFNGRKERDYGAAAGTIHSKSITVDGEVSIISSYNMDPRSQNLNLEVGVRVESKALAKQLEDRFEHWKRSSGLHSKNVSGKRLFLDRCSLFFMKGLTSVFRHQL